MIATRADLLTTAINNIAQRLADITANPKPTYTEDGASYDWAGYFAMLTDKQLALEQALQRCDGPFEVRSMGF